MYISITLYQTPQSTGCRIYTCIYDTISRMKAIFIAIALFVGLYWLNALLTP